MDRAGLPTESIPLRAHGAGAAGSLVLPGATVCRPTALWPTVPRVVLLELDGASYELLVPLAEAGVMPHLAEWMQSAALVRLAPTTPCAEAVLWTTLETGAGPEVHGVLDNCFLDHRRRRVVSSTLREPCSATLADVVTAADPGAGAIRLVDAQPAGAVWRRRPWSLDELSQGIAWIEGHLRRMVEQATRVDALRDWRLLAMRIDLLDPLQHRLWNLLGIDSSPGGQRPWIAKTREAFAALDRALAELFWLAQRRQAAVMIVSPYRLGPLEERISLGEVLRRRGLMCPGSGIVQTTHRFGRWLDKLWWHVRSAAGQFPSSPALPAVQSLRKVTPLDWRRSRAMSLHGEMAAFIYLNTPQRFGSRLLRTRRERDQAATEVLWALQEAVHPVTGQRLFAEAFLTAERYGGDPLERLWPDVVAIPAAGFQTRPGLDRNRQLLRTDPATMATHRPGGMWMAALPRVRPGQAYTADLADVAPTILKLLGLWRPRSMTGRPVAEMAG